MWNIGDPIGLTRNVHVPCHSLKSNATLHLAGSRSGIQAVFLTCVPWRTCFQNSPQGWMRHTSAVPPRMGWTPPTLQHQNKRMHWALSSSQLGTELLGYTPVRSLFVVLSLQSLTGKQPPAEPGSWAQTWLQWGFLNCREAGAVCTVMVASEGQCT